MELDALTLSRLQFAFTVAFHILFPTLTIGLASFLAVLEARWLIGGRRKRVYLQLYNFWLKIFGLAFGLGVVSGVALSYQFGTNFSGFALATGSVLGPLMSYEVLTAFFLQAGFLGVMLFGRERVGPELHFCATLLVALGTIVSAFWIVSANSWMHTPAGFVFEDGIFTPTDWAAIVFNPSFPYRFAHMLLASYLSTAFIVAGVSAWYLRQRRYDNFARHGYSMALWLVLALAPLQIVAGNLHGLNTQTHQPIKVAAMIGLWQTRAEAPAVLIGIPDSGRETNHATIEIPAAASLILKQDRSATVLGLDAAPPEERPNVALVFFAFRIMVGIGLFFLIVALWSAVARLAGALYRWRRLMRATIVAGPLGFVATIAGWVVTESGRQPWAVQGILLTSETAAPVPAGSVLASFLVFVVVYGALFAAFLYYVLRLVRNGPDETVAAAVSPRGRSRAVADPVE